MVSGRDGVARRSLTSPGGRSIIVAVTVCPGERFPEVSAVLTVKV